MVGYPHHSNVDLDPSFHFNADPGPSFHFSTDPDPHKGDANLRPLHGSILGSKAPQF
jgi:hypothetical protein